MADGDQRNVSVRFLQFHRRRAAVASRRVEKQCRSNQSLVAVVALAMGDAGIRNNLGLEESSGRRFFFETF